MSTQFTNRQWRLPNNENKDKQSNYSMDFDGSQNIDLGNSTQVQPVKEMSISAWINASASSTYLGIVSCQYPGASYDGFSLHVHSSNKIQFSVSELNGSKKYVNSTSTITTGQWYHLAVTYDGANIKLYFNGSLEDPGISMTGNIDYTDGLRNTKIGSLYPSGLYFTGQIDAVSIFDYALSSSQVTTLYGSSSTGIGNPMTLNPVAFYNLGDKSAFNNSNYLIPNSSLKDFVFDFDGTNDYISIPNSTDFDLGSSFTISGWFNVTSYVSNMGYISFDGSSTRGWFLFHQSTNLALYDGTSVRTLSLNLQPTNQWNSYIITYDGTDLIFYLNGQQNSTQAVSSNLQTNGNGGQIGNQQFAAGRFYSGSISNVQVFNTALPATGSNSVETLYNNGSPLTLMSGFTSLVSWWKLDASDTYDSSTGNWTIEDHAGSNDGTSSGMTQANLVQSDLSFKTSISPFALDFDGANDFVTMGSPLDLRFNRSDAFSFSAWVNVSATANNTIISNQLAPSTNYRGYYFAVQSNKLNTIFRSTLSDRLIFNGATNRSSGWNHVVFTYDGTSTTSSGKFYINGSAETTTGSGTLTATAESTDTVYLGCRSNADNFFNGSLSNVSIWNTDLTSAQVSEIYSEGIPQNLSNHSAVSSLVSWWQLGSNSSFNSSLNQWTCIDEKGTNTGESSQTFNEDAIVDGVGSYANGVGTSGLEVIGSAPFSDANSLSINMDVLDRVEDTPA